ncbi:MAG TPA: hypothetical protein VK427_09170, partial [Kofleriaceae bacterium]|nr:hypothetical protein [Kofleriaceae bacterium]
KKLDDARESERAVTELEQLGNPGAIDALGKAWIAQGKPVRLLQVIISLARPLTPEEAKAKFVTDYEKTGRKAHWDAALPYLKKALTDVDETNPRSVDSATKAADALGESQAPGGLEALVDIANKSVDDYAKRKKLITAQVAAVRAIGKYENEKPAAAAALMKIIDREPPSHPRLAKDKETRRAAEERFTIFLATSGAAINSIAELRAPTAAKTLVLSLYRTPELFDQIRRALVGAGPDAKGELKKILKGEHAEVNQLFKDKRLDKYCGDKGDAPPDQCQDVSAKEFYAAVVLGDFYDASSSAELLAALERSKPVPAYYVDEQPGPTQYNAIFDALRKIGAADAAPKVYAMFAGGGKKGAGAADTMTKILAIGAYPFLARDMTGVPELGKIAADNTADDGLRQEAATAFARMSRDKADIAVLETLATKYFDAADKKRKEGEGKPKADADAADKELEAQKKAYDAIKVEMIKITKDTSKSAEDIKAMSDKVKKAEEDFKAFKKKHRDKVAPFKSADNAAKAYKGYARMFQTHIARIEVALRCKEDLACYAGTLKQTPDDATKNLTPYIKDLKDWTKEEKLGLVEGGIERAMLELGKAGQKASAHTDLLLDNAKSDNRLIRQSILLALPKIAAVPCNNCEAKLDAAIKAGEGKTTIGQLNFETTMLRNYFSWAGGKAPSKSSSAPADAPAPAAPPAEKKPADEAAAEQPAKK